MIEKSDTEEKDAQGAVKTHTSSESEDTFQLKQILQMMNVLRADVTIYLDQMLQMQTPTSSVMRRSYARALFAFIEGTMWGLKWFCYNIGSSKSGRFTAEEMLLLSEREIKPQIDGSRPREQNIWFREEPMKIGLETNLQFTFGMVGKLGGIRYSVDKGTAGWGKFKSAIKVRDRLTHPKSPDHLLVADDEVEVLCEAQLWFEGEMEKVLELVSREYQQTLENALGTALRENEKNLGGVLSHGTE